MTSHQQHFYVHQQPHISHTQAFAPQYYYPTELDGQFAPSYQDYDFLGHPMAGGAPEDISVISTAPDAGMAAASSSNGYESPPASEHIIESQDRHTMSVAQPSSGPIPHQHTQSDRQYYHAAPPPVPQASEPYPIATAHQSGPVRVTGRRSSATASYVLVDTDPDGTVWIKFEYTRNRVKWLYRVRCDVERVDEEECLTNEFKQDNCIYPKAMVPAEEYTGHRQKYETECNHLGWRLSWLNPDLRNRRGLIQRAVDSYRNSSGDISVRSRRVRRLAKQQVTPRR